jgi:hypothetical protein
MRGFDEKPLIPNPAYHLDKKGGDAVFLKPFLPRAFTAAL